MAVTEYIGPLVGPVFADPAEWTSTRSYESLTIVLHEGNSYTARQDVPIGVQITNENYWLETGNYNAQVEAYRKATINSMKYLETADMFSTVTWPTLGTLIKTSGFHTSNDNGGATYIVAEGTANGLDSIEIGNGYCAIMIIEQMITLEQLGAYGNGINDDTKCLTRALEIGTGHCIKVSGKKFLVQGTFTIPKNIEIAGVSQSTSVIYNPNMTAPCFVPADDTSYDNHTYQIGLGVYLHDISIQSNYGYSDCSKQNTIAGINGYFIGSTIRNVSFLHIPCGIYQTTPDFQGNDYNKYNVDYGDTKLLDNISVNDALYGVYLKGYDTTITNLSIGQIYNYAFYIAGYVIQNLRCWNFAQSNYLGNCRVDNLEIDYLNPNVHTKKAYGVVIHDRVYISNLYMHMMYRDVNKDILGGCIYLDSVYANAITNFQVGANQWTETEIYAPIVDADSSMNLGTLEISNCIINNNFSSVTASKLFPQSVYVNAISYNNLNNRQIHYKINAVRSPLLVEDEAFTLRIHEFTDNTNNLGNVALHSHLMLQNDTEREIPICVFVKSPNYIRADLVLVDGHYYVKCFDETNTTPVRYENKTVTVQVYGLVKY